MISQGARTMIVVSGRAAGNWAANREIATQRVARVAATPGGARCRSALESWGFLRKARWRRPAKKRGGPSLGRAVSRFAESPALSVPLGTPTGVLQSLKGGGRKADFFFFDVGRGWFGDSRALWARLLSNCSFWADASGLCRASCSLRVPSVIPISGGNATENRAHRAFCWPVGRESRS